MGVAVADEFRSAQGAWSTLQVHEHGGLEYRAARRSADDLHLCCLPRFGQCPVATGGVRRFGGRPAANPACPGKASELGSDEHVAEPLATPSLGAGHRLALDTLLRPSTPESQRNLPEQTEARHHTLSHLCHGLYRSVWPPLYSGPHVGQAPRKYGNGVAAPAGTDSRIGRKNQGFAAGSCVLQHAGYGLPARRASSVSDARHVPRTTTEEETQERRQERSALDQTSKSWLVSSHLEERHHASNDLGVCRLPHVSQPQKAQTRATKASVRSLARRGNSNRYPRTLPETLWHRI